jgi:monofunctional biosynthetic peptidoglycan transglycosylase
MPDSSHPALEAAPLADRTSRTVVRRLARNALPCLWRSFYAGTIVLVLAAAMLTALAAIPILTFRHVDPPGSMLMLSQSLSGQAIDQRWVPLERISPNLVRAVIASEDNGFCRHPGIDLKEIEAAWDKAETWGEDAARGGSTITMQVAKNLFLWNSRSYLRKAIEIPLALGIEQAWPKERILEVYLNIAEWGPGIFGAEAAAQRHFRKPASRLTEREAALLAATLPNPILRNPGRPSPGVARIAGIVERRARLLGTRAACVLPR